MAAIVQKLVLDDVVKYLLHPGYNIDLITLNNGDIALEVGDSLLGKLAWNSSGTTWKILDSADVITASSIICPIVYNRKLIAAAAADAAGFLTKVPIIRRGPALVHKDVLFYDEQVEATVDAALLALGIKPVDETGLLLNYDIIV